MLSQNAYAGRGLHGQIVEQLGIRIIDGRYAPGTLLLAEMLEREFDVSLTVIREAMKVLAAKGLIESRQKRGTAVRPREQWSLLDRDVIRWQNASAPDFTFLENLAELRAIIEPAAARLAAARRTEAQLAEMDDALAAMSAAGDDLGRLVNADVRFHRALLDAAHNELFSQLRVVLEAGVQVSDHFMHRSSDSSDSLGRHDDVCDAIRVRDADRAEQRITLLLAGAADSLQAAKRAASRGRAE